MEFVILYFFGFFVGWLGNIFIDLFIKISRKIIEIFPIGTVAPTILAIIGHTMAQIYIEIFIGLVSYIGIRSFDKFLVAEFGVIVAIYGEKMLDLIDIYKNKINSW